MYVRDCRGRALQLAVKNEYPINFIKARLGKRSRNKNRHCVHRAGFVPHVVNVYLLQSIAMHSLYAGI